MQSKTEHVAALSAPIVRYVRAGRRPARATNDEVLCRLEFGASFYAPGVVSMPFEPLDDPPLSEVWTTNVPTRSFSAGSITGRRTDELLFGHVTASAGDIAEQTQDVYADIIDLCRDQGLSLLRIWNAVPRIHEDDAGLDRYMQFCLGRGAAFEGRLGERFERALPACSAVGSADGPLVVAFLASRTPGMHLENPRQVSAYRYPREYGPRSPSFARATVAPTTAGGLFFWSGTASIVGHRSVHAGDVVAQTRETIRNLRVLAFGEGGARRSLAGQMCAVKVYLRSAEDYRAVDDILRPELGDSAQTIYLLGDICRRELLVEIEAVGTPAGSPWSQGDAVRADRGADR